MSQTPATKPILPVVEVVAISLISLLGVGLLYLFWQLVADLPASATLTLVSYCRQHLLKPDLFLLTLKTFSTGLVLVGVSLILVKVAATVVKQRRQMEIIDQRSVGSHAKVQQILRKHQWSSTDISIIDSHQFVACTTGLWRPKIVLSTALVKTLPINSLEAVICHEMYHRCYRHPLIVLVASLLSSGLFYLPILTKWQALLSQLLELKADQFVIKQQGTSIYLERAGVLLGQQTASTALVATVGFSQFRHIDLTQTVTRSFVFSSLASLVLMTGLFWIVQARDTAAVVAASPDISANCSFESWPPAMCLAPEKALASRCENKFYSSIEEK